MSKNFCRWKRCGISQLSKIQIDSQDFGHRLLTSHEAFCSDFLFQEDMEIPACISVRRPFHHGLMKPWCFVVCWLVLVSSFGCCVCCLLFCLFVSCVFV